MYWDRAARKKNLADARRLWRVRRMDLADARALFPGFDHDALDARWSVGLDPDEPIKTLEEKRRRDENVTDAFDRPQEVAIVQCQWFEREPYWLVADPVTNRRVALGVNESTLAAQRAEQLGLTLSAVKLTRRVYRQAFIGSEVLEVGPAPCLDRNAGTWFALRMFAAGFDDPPPERTGVGIGDIGLASSGRRGVRNETGGLRMGKSRAKRDGGAVR
jgi:hypothetical protein